MSDRAENDDDHPMPDADPGTRDSDDDDDNDNHPHPPPLTQPPSTQFTRHIPTESELDAKYPHRPKNPHPTPPFHVLYTELFEPLLSNKQKQGVGGRGFKNLKPHEVRRQIIERFAGKWRLEVGPDIYPAFRLIMPDKDRDRTVYGLKEKGIGKIFIKLMKINKTSPDAFALINWKLPGMRSAATGDFAGRCYEVIRKRPMRTSPGSLTVAQVNDMLDRLSLSNKEEQQLPIMEEFYMNMCAEELMWMVRIILKQMKVGATEKTFFQAWHPDAENLFNVSSSLKRVCWELHDPQLRLDNTEKGITLMSCFQPQLAQFQKRSLEDTVKVIQSRGFRSGLLAGQNTPEAEEFWIEEKLDGERMQMHMKDGEFRFWSRKAKDYTYLYGAEYEEGSLTRYLKEAFDPGVRNIILDGEMITWDPTLDCIVAFGTLKTACLSQASNPFDTTCNRPLFRVFDILYLNNESLVSYTLSDRRRALERALRPVHRRFEVHKYTPATAVQEIEDSLRRVVAEASEGLVIKNPRSMYCLNERNDDWMKVKPEYMTEFGEDLDCLIIGGYYGSGRRGGILSTFLCGLRVDGNFLKPGDGENRFWSFFKVGGGLTASDYLKIQHLTAGKWEKYDPKRPPKEFIELAGGPLQHERPDEWIRPEDSLVVAVKAAQVAPTDQFRMGKTLRFPRFKALREDKDWRTALTITEFINLKARVDQELGEKQIKVEKRVGSRTTARKKRQITVVGHEITPAQDDLAPQFAHPVFADMGFYIMTDQSSAPKKTKVELEQLVKTHGGCFFQSENPAASAVRKIYVIGDKKTVKVAALIRAQAERFDVIRPQWILDSLDQYSHDLSRPSPLPDPPGQPLHPLPLTPSYLLHATRETATRVQKNIDKYGDSLHRDLSSPAELKKVLDDMPLPIPPPGPALSLETRRAEIFSELQDSHTHDNTSHPPTPETEEEIIKLPGWTLSKCTIYLNLPPSSPSPTPTPTPAMTATSYLLLALGARISRDIHEKDITHVVVDGRDVARVRGIRESFAGGGKVPRVVEVGWVEECLRERSWVDEGRWEVRG